MPDLIIKPTTTSGNKLILKDQGGGAVLTTADSGATLGNSTQDNITRLGTVTTGTIGGSTVVNTSGAVTTTGAFTSQGIDDNSSGTTGLSFASTGIPTFPLSEFYKNGVHSWEFSFTGINTTAVDFDFTVPDIGYFYFIAGFGSEQAVGY